MFHYFISITFAVFIVPHFVLGKGKIISLTDDSWSEMLEGEWMVEFYAPWCPACQQLEPLWKDFSQWSEDLNIKIANIDVTSNPGLSGRFMITTLPTIYHAKDGVFRQYKGARDKDSFISFIEEKKWMDIKEINGFSSPNSMLMSTVSHFFKLSMTLRNVHNTMVEDYGIPYWGSYIIFGISTILIGAILGLIIVCIIDAVCPAKPSYLIHPEDEDKHEQEENQAGDNEDMKNADVNLIEEPRHDELRQRKAESDTGRT